ncbi:universal stress protein [Corynebacterium sp. H113]|uniref:universal stress protein n=1 Tax=Corynebacterium sp. H113 TaxID=3133419 RepID=UPI0030A2CCE4
MTAPDSMLIAYDGSDEAKRALDWASKVLSVKTAYILTAWEPLQRQAARTAGASGMMQPDWDSSTVEEDPAQVEAKRVCEEGLDLAAKAGFQAEPYLVQSETTIWSAIVDAANQLDASVIVSGTRGMSGLRGLLSTSTADAIVKNAGRPVLICPPEKN